MGTDIFSAVEVFDGTKWHQVKDKLFPSYTFGTFTSEPFDQRNYGMFGFLSDTMNYSYVPPIAQARDWPENQECFQPCEDYDRWGRSWLLLSELLAFDYSQTFEDRHCMTDGNGAADSGPSNGEVKTFREFLPELYFRDLEIMKGLADNPDHVRVVFGFS